MTEAITDKRAAAKALMVKAKFYRMTSILFLIVGLIIFLVVYFQKVDGQVLQAFRNPVIALALIVPFLPAAMLAKMADKAQQQMHKLLEKPAGEKAS